MEQKKMEVMPSDKMTIIKNSLFFTAYTIWTVRALINTTFFNTADLYAAYQKQALYVVILLCMLTVAVDFRFQIREIGVLFLICLFFWISYSNSSLAYAASVALIYAGAGLSFRQVIKWSLVLKGALLVFVVSCSLLGVIPNYPFVQAIDRIRYGLGFIYCSFTSHYLLLFSMLYIVLRKRIRWFELVLILGLNYAGFLVTDTKTDLLALGLMLTVTIFLRLFYNKKKVLHVFSYIAFAVPFVFCVVSYWIAKSFDMTSPIWLKADQILNHRIGLSFNALQTYPVYWFGQNIEWVGGSAFLKDPTSVYNYVDNNYLTVLLQFGIVFTFFMCFVYGRAIYISIRKNQLALAAALFVFMVIGLVNPEMRSLGYNTFLLVLLKPADQFEGIELWKPRKERMKDHVHG